MNLSASARLVPIEAEMGTDDGLGETAFTSVLPAAQAGAGWALEALWRAYAGKVAGYLRLQGASDADDLTSEVFVGVLRGIASFNGGEAQFRSWLFTIAHRRLADRRRSFARQPVMEEVVDVEPAASSSEDVEATVLRQLATERVRKVCDQLPADQRDVVLLRIVAGLPVDAVAEAVGKSPGAVKALQRRGLANVRKIFSREGVTL